MARNIVKLVGVAVTTAAVMFTMAACGDGGKKKESNAAAKAAIEAAGGLEAAAAAGESATGEASASASDVPAPGTGGDIETLIKNYEKFLEVYAGMVKKMKGGDMSVYAELPKYMEDMNKWLQSFQGLAATATPENLARIEALTEKYAAELEQ